MFPLTSILRRVIPAILLAGLVSALPAHAQYQVPTETYVYPTVESGYISIYAQTTSQAEGYISIYDNGNFVCGYDANYEIACEEKNPVRGTHTFIAYFGGGYEGDVYYEPSQSSPVKVTYP